MKYLKLVIVAGLVSVVSANASAFEQTQLGGASTPAGSKSSNAGSVASGVPGVGLAVPGAGAALKSQNSTESSGTILSIPGFGVIGTLPKMDFGLELLYGNDRDKPVEEDSSLTDNGLTIHGSVKHRF